MVIESLINPSKAEGHPFEMFIIGAIYASIATFLSLWIFKDYASLVMVFLTVIASVPLVYSVIRIEEEKDSTSQSETFLLKEHGKAVMVFVFLFLGYLASFTVWFSVLPESIVTNMFNVQLETIRAINSNAIVGLSTGGDFLMQIFSNNIKVMIFCILFAFLFGAGAIFILTWNASVIAAAIGTFFRNNISVYSEAAGLGKMTGYFHIGSTSVLRYMVHGIPEIAAYFVAGLAGGIISVAVIRHDFGTDKFKKIVMDSIDLIVIAILMLVVAAAVEVFVTPRLF
ncbi:MAG: stage II sporulation protein M [Nanoarchaeota archaeon]|nr:stage II sporulation protein M [Nanoarchaeota archaeon]